MAWTWTKKMLVKFLFSSIGGLKPLLSSVIRREQDKVGKLDPDVVADAIVKEIETLLFKGDAPATPEPPAK